MTGYIRLAEPIYLDFNASAPPEPEVVDAMLPWLHSFHGNPHSENFHGSRAAVAVENAKCAIGSLIGADGDDIVLTSCATESNNLALLGFLGHRALTGALIHSAIEHECVMEAGRELRRIGCTVTAVSPNEKGVVTAQAIRSAVEANDREHLLVSVMHANNELGTVAPLREIARQIGHGATLHTDASQSAGRIPFDVDNLEVDVVTLSSHKIGGPAGVGALYIAPHLRAQFRPILHGGGQQRGLRSGTIPTFLAVGYGVACELAKKRLESNARHVELMASQFEAVLRARGVAFARLGDAGNSLPGLLSLLLLGRDARDVLDRCRWSFSASTGSACASGEVRASHVLRAIGLSEEQAAGVLRIGFGPTTSALDVVEAAGTLADAIGAAAT